MKTLILTHADADGLCSGALLKSVHPDAEVFFTKPVSLLADLKSLPEKYSKIFISDIAINKRDAKDIVNFLERFPEESTSFQYPDPPIVTWFDHHIIPSTIKKSDLEIDYVHYFNDLNACASEIVYRHFEKTLPPEKVWLAIYGAIGDYIAESEFVKTWMRSWDARALYFEVSTLVLGIKEEKFNSYSSKRKIVTLLSSGKNPSDIPGLVDAASTAVTKEFKLYEIIKKRALKSNNIGYAEDLPHFGFRGPSALFAATATGTPVGFSVFFTPRFIDITIRSTNPKIPLNILAEKASEFVGGSGGGHPTASGCRIPVGTFDKFLKKANEVLKGYL